MKAELPSPAWQWGRKPAITDKALNSVMIIEGDINDPYCID
jgi:hypothetical protein